jgi:type 1 fimbriae regulatory protein FimB/type 1 fimbriae regulatory protein FimE
MSKTRRRKSARKTSDHLLPREVVALLKAAKASGRHGHRNYTLILLCYRHGLRVSELTELRWRMVDLKRRLLRVNRAKGGINSVHPLSASEVAALRKVKADYPGHSFIFVTNRGGALSKRTVARIVAQAGRDAGLKTVVSPGMLRLSCGYALARAGRNMVALQHYLGYRNMRHAMRFFEMPDKPFKDFWKDLGAEAA